MYIIYHPSSLYILYIIIPSEFKLAINFTFGENLFEFLYTLSR